MNAFDYLVLERDALLMAQWWRLWTGHLAHTGPRHLFGNLAALGLLLAWARARNLARTTLVYALLAAPLISIGLLALLPWLQWYAGLSGLLHGLLVILLTRLGPKTALVGLTLLAAKITLESHNLWPAGSGQHLVIWQAHALGALSGLLFALRPVSRARPQASPGCSWSSSSSP
jgi:rhomboid family GlyGly-CTERM serine protease